MSYLGKQRLKPETKRAIADAEATFALPAHKDRGSQRGAKWFVVADRTLYTYALAKQHGIKGIVFRSGKEAKRWISLNQEQQFGLVKNLRRGKDARFSLQARNPEGLMVHVCYYIADFVYDAIVTTSGTTSASHEWREVVEDTKPSGFTRKHGKKLPFREDTYLLKKKWFEAQYGRVIRET